MLKLSGCVRDVELNKRHSVYTATPTTTIAKTTYSVVSATMAQDIEQYHTITQLWLCWTQSHKWVLFPQEKLLIVEFHLEKLSIAGGGGYFWKEIKNDQKLNKKPILFSNECALRRIFRIKLFSKSIYSSNGTAGGWQFYMGGIFHGEIETASPPRNYFLCTFMMLQPTFPSLYR